MTIVNTSVTAQYGLMCADSLLSYGDPGRSILVNEGGRPAHDAKIVALPALPGVFATVGNSASMRTRLQGIVHWLSTPQDVIERVPQIMLQELKELDGRAGTIFEALFVMWDSQAGRMLSASFHSRDDFCPDVKWATSQGHWVNRTNPPFPLSAETDPTSPEGAYQFMKQQLAHFRSLNPNAPAGGLCVVAEVTPLQITMRALGDLGMPTPRDVNQPPNSESTWEA